ncbi:MAG: hypothetical protein K9L99_06045, partial [Candidatus Omnitrophica bacterium]|nr:hypothetical protein [Candidatus Omnitrophota bacterium]
YKNQKEIIIEENKIVSICIYSDNKTAGQEGFVLDTTNDLVFAFSNGFNEGYIEYNSEERKITVNGNINTYIVVV